MSAFDADALKVDRDGAEKELASQFTVTEHPDPHVPNEVTRAQFDQLVATYSDVRLGRTHIQFAKNDSDKFKAGAMKDIGAILQTDSGRAMIKCLAYATKKDGSFKTTTLSEKAAPVDDVTWVTDPAKRDDISDGGPGASASIGYAPGLDLSIAGATDKWLPQRSDVALYHEMVHAYHLERGDFAHDDVTGRIPAVDKNANLDNLDAEYQAVGKGKYAQERFTENAYRAERSQLAGHAGARDDDADKSAPRTNYVPTCESGMAHKDKDGVRCGK
jgi:hypothetical protein